jgi:hypothetical protein
MKKLCILLALFSDLGLAAQIPNFSFESWGPNPDEPTTQAPTGWITNNNTNIPDFVQQSNSGSDGASSSRLNIRLIGGSLKYGGQILTAFPCSARPAKLSFYYRMNIGAGTAASVNAQVILYNSGQSDNALGANLSDVSSTATVWTYKELPIGYGRAGTPDSALINFSLVAGSDAGAYFMIDELRFSSAPAGIDDVSGTPFSCRYLKSMKSIEIVSTEVIGEGTPELYGIAGQRVDCPRVQVSPDRWLLDVSTLGRGLYLVSLNSNGRHLSTKVLFD